MSMSVPSWDASQGNGFISSEHLPTLINGLPQWQCPPVEELRKTLDPDQTSLILWDSFQRTVMPMHPQIAEHIRLQSEQEKEQQAERGFSAPARNQRGAAEAMTMFHCAHAHVHTCTHATRPLVQATSRRTLPAAFASTRARRAHVAAHAPVGRERLLSHGPSSHRVNADNGLGGGGHAHKRGLRQVDVTPGGAAGQPAAEGLAACITTRWKDALVTHEGPPPSIVRVRTEGSPACAPKAVVHVDCSCRVALRRRIDTSVFGCELRSADARWTRWRARKIGGQVGARVDGVVQHIAVA
jgi:hypothetical protein